MSSGSCSSGSVVLSSKLSAGLLTCSPVTSTGCKMWGASMKTGWVRVHLDVATTYRSKEMEYQVQHPWLLSSMHLAMYTCVSKYRQGSYKWRTRLLKMFAFCEYLRNWMHNFVNECYDRRPELTHEGQGQHAWLSLCPQIKLVKVRTQSGFEWWRNGFPLWQCYMIAMQILYKMCTIVHQNEHNRYHRKMLVYRLFVDSWMPK